MRKLIILILIIIGVAVLYFWNSGPETSITNPSIQTQGFKPDPSGANFSGIEGEFSILDKKAYGDLNDDTKTDASVFLAESGGGSGVFIYVAAYVSGPINYKGSSAIFLGDRIAPQNISISNGMITVRYLDRKEDEPYAAEPTVSVTKTFVYKNGELEER